MASTTDSLPTLRGEGTVYKPVRNQGAFVDLEPPSPISPIAQGAGHSPEVVRTPRHDPGQTFLAEGSTIEKPAPSTELHRSSYALISVLMYSALTLFAWIVTYITNFRPATACNYGYDGF